jgi:hypothetical protein
MLRPPAAAIGKNPSESTSCIFSARLGKCQRRAGLLSAWFSRRCRRNTMPMQTHIGSDTRPLVLKRPGERQRRQVLARPTQSRRDISELVQPDIKRDASRFYNHGGAVVVASAWLAFFVFAVIYQSIASAN